MRPETTYSIAETTPCTKLAICPDLSSTYFMFVKPQNKVFHMILFIVLVHLPIWINSNGATIN